MINPAWEDLFRKRDWGRYPDLNLVRFIMRNYADRWDKHYTVLELGCGIGANLKFLNSEGFHCWGMDCSETAIKRVGQIVGPNIGIVGDVSDLGNYYADFTFDIIIDVGCFVHQSNRQEIVDQVYKKLRPGGRVFFSEMVSEMCSIYDETTVHTDLMAVNDPMFQPNIPYHFFTEEEILMLFKKFQNVQLEYTMRSYAHRKRFYDRFFLQGQKL